LWFVLLDLSEDLIEAQEVRLRHAQPVCEVGIAEMILIRLYQRVAEEDMPAICFLMLGAFGFFSIAGTHDWFALNRVRIVAVEEIYETGIPKTAIHGPSNTMGGRKSKQPVSSTTAVSRFLQGFHKNMRMYRLPERCWHFFGWYAAAIDPKYLIVSSPSSCFADSTFSPVTFRAWLPPFQRTVYVQQMKSDRQ
jgi:hypothetical protein